MEQEIKENNESRGNKVKMENKEDKSADKKRNIDKILSAVESSMQKTIGVKIEELNKDITEKLSRGAIIGIHIDTSVKFKEAKKKFKKDYLKKLLTTNYGNVSLVSKLANVDRRSVHRLLSKSKKDLGKIREEMLKKDYVKRIDIGQGLQEVLGSYKDIIHPQKLESVYANIDKVSGEIAEVFGEEPLTLKEAEEEFEKEYLAQVLKENGSNVSAAAKKIGLRYETLHRKLKKMGIV